MPQSNHCSLWDKLNAAGHLSGRFLQTPDASIALAELDRGSSLGAPLSDLDGCSALVVTRDQLTAALTLIELDGIARRLVICPPDLPFAHVSSIAAAGVVDTVVSEQAMPEAGAPGLGRFVPCAPRIAADGSERPGMRRETEWVLLTSGTTGMPKMVVHTLSRLTAAIKRTDRADSPTIWSTFYDIRRYGGLQILLRALLHRASMVLSDAREPIADFLARAGAQGVTHISGTPSHWRRALMSPAAGRISPRGVRLSGEIADQGILNHLRAFYGDARIAHAFASTEAGVAFAVDDGLAGFPADFLERYGSEVEMKIEDASLRIRSTRTALRYLGNGRAIADSDGFIDTGDLVERRGDRCYFIGRRDGVINVGGLKVNPEEVEAVINRHPGVRMSLVRARKSPITGAVVVAEIVARSEPDLDGNAPKFEALKIDILEDCRRALAGYKVPASIRFVPSLDVNASGKLARRNA